MFSIIPDVERLAQAFTLAAAPAFFLGACIALASLMLGRLDSIAVQLRMNSAESPDRKSQLLKRARLLHSGITLVLVAGICSALLLVVTFAAAFFRLQQAYGAGLLFAAAGVLVAIGLFRFTQEVRVAQYQINGLQ